MKAIIWNDESLGAKFDIVDIPDDLLEQANEYHEKLVELAVEQDEDLLMGYLEGEYPTVEQLKACIRKGTLALDFVPVLTGTAFKNKGVQPLLDAVVDYMPSPVDVDAIKGTSVDGETDMVRAEPLRRAALDPSTPLRHRHRHRTPPADPRPPPAPRCASRLTRSPSRRSPSRS